MRVCIAAFVLCLSIAGSATSPGQAARPRPVTPSSFSNPTSVISPVVVAQWFTTRNASAEELELLVLWRGTPGWFLQPGGVGGGNGWYWIKYGDVTLSLGFDPATRMVTVQDREIPLMNNNVLFVDDVDTRGALRVAGMMTVPRAMPGSAGQIAPVLRSAPRIMSFLDCDAGKESPWRALLETLCLQNLGVAR